MSGQTSSNEGSGSKGQFPSTQWTQVEMAGRDEASGRPALAILLSRYRSALIAHVVRKEKCSPERAEDLLQSFIAQSILERHLLAKADRGRGSRFRSFLLTALDNFVINEFEKQNAKKRSAGSPVWDIDEQADVVAARSTSEEFDVAWAREVITETVSRMEAQCAQTHRSDLWNLFDGRVLRPLLYGDEPVQYREIVGRLGYSSPVQASNAVVNAKRMFQRILRQVIGEYAADAADVETEIEELMAALSIAGAD